MTHRAQQTPENLAFRRDLFYLNRENTDVREIRRGRETVMASNRRKLVALDAEDLAVVSAHCQDAVLKLRDARFFPSERRFVLELNRFAWEEGERQKERRKSVLHFERVERASTQGINQRDREQVLSLLAMLYTPSDSPAGFVDLVFSGDFQIRLSVECIEVQLTDMDASWEASSVPVHKD